MRCSDTGFLRDLANALDVADSLAAAAVADAAEPDPELVGGIGHKRSPPMAGACVNGFPVRQDADVVRQSQKVLDCELATPSSTVATNPGCADNDLGAFGRQCFYLALPLDLLADWLILANGSFVENIITLRGPGARLRSEPG